MKWPGNPGQIVLQFFSVFILIKRLECQQQTILKESVISSLHPHPVEFSPSNFSIMDNIPILTTDDIDDIITPSDTCKEIVAKFASAVSNFTQCSVTNSRPIHICGWCIGNYLAVKKCFHDFFVTVDERDRPCKDYFTNLDRIEIVNDAYNYVINLWTKGYCDYCFQHFENGTIISDVTEEYLDFLLNYENTKSCFNDSLQKKDNGTCTHCKMDYEHLNSVYIDIVAKNGDNVCLDIVDTMNTTRELWNEYFKCVPPRKAEIWLHVGMGLVGMIPVLFYLFSYIFSTKQEARVFHQRRLAEMFSVSHSAASENAEYLSSGDRQPGRSPTITSHSGNSSSEKTSDTTQNKVFKIQNE